MRRPKRIEPGPGQESVWDYPRPPRAEPSRRLVTVRFGGFEIARSERALRVLETASPPTYYVPAEDVRTDLISPADGSTWCEWKGRAAYFDVMVGDRVARRAAWSYPDPNPRFTLLKGHLAFYPGRVDGCYLDDELVAPQAGGFYGGWVTADIAGPMKGDPGTLGW